MRRGKSKRKRNRLGIRRQRQSVFVKSKRWQISYNKRLQLRLRG